MARSLGWHASRRAAASLLLVAALDLAGTAKSDANDLGTAGPFHSVGGLDCRGAHAADAVCQPIVVDATSTARQQSDAVIAQAIQMVGLLRMSEAAAALDKAVAADPSNIAALTLRARFMLTEGRGLAAVQAINAALQRAPDDANVLATKAFSELDPEDFAQGLRDAERAVTLDPLNPDVRAIRARFYVLAHCPSLAAVDLAFVLSQQPQNADARVLRAQVLLDMKDYDGAVREATTVLAQTRFNVTALQVRSTANSARGDDAAALADLDTLVGPSLEAASRRATPLFHADIVQRVVALLRLKRDAEAKSAIDALVGSDGSRSILRLQVYLSTHGFPNVVIDGTRSDSFNTALASCFAERTCGPHLP